MTEKSTDQDIRDALAIMKEKMWEDNRDTYIMTFKPAQGSSLPPKIRAELWVRMIEAAAHEARQYLNRYDYKLPDEMRVTVGLDNKPIVGFRSTKWSER